MSRHPLHSPSNSSNSHQTNELLYNLGLVRKPKESRSSRSETARSLLGKTFQSSRSPVREHFYDHYLGLKLTSPSRFTGFSSSKTHGSSSRASSILSANSSRSALPKRNVQTPQSLAPPTAPTRRPSEASLAHSQRGTYQDLGDRTHGDGLQTSFNWRAGRSMAGVMDLDRARTRRERTFIGSECAVCEEPLEHTLRGERILQFSCGHVSHEACFYEYIKEFEAQSCPTCNAPLGLDTSRGGNVLDLGTVSLPKAESSH